MRASLELQKENQTRETACKLPLLTETTFSLQSTLFLYQEIRDRTLDSAFKALVNKVAKV